MIGALLLHTRRLGAPNALPRRLLAGLLQLLSEAEARVLRPDERTFLREAYLRVQGVQFTRPLYFSQGFRLYRTSLLRIGPRASFGENCGLYVHADLTIGSDFIAAPGLTINNGIHDLATLQPSAAPIVIGDRVWCGVNVTLVAGASVGDDCVIGANSLVMSAIPPRCLAAGTPARVIRHDIRPEEHRPLWSGFPRSA